MTVMPNGVSLTLDNNGVSRATAASAENGPELDALYTQWKRDPSSVDAQWHAFFSGFELGCQQPPRTGAAAKTAAAAPASDHDRFRQSRVDALVSAYRRLGHQQAKLDPLSLVKRTTPELSLEYMKLTEADLDRQFEIYWAGRPSTMTLRTIIDLLRETYCGHVGIEYMHIENYTIRRWLRDRIEEGRLHKDVLPNAEKKRVLTHLLEGELFEKFLHTRYVGQKRFSLEGGETIIPILDKILEECPRHGVEQIVMGMAHRGRLNVLANILGKDYEFVFNEFAENYVPNSEQGDGDVKYHLGYDAVVTTSKGTQIGLSLAPNPSHLETVNPVVEGKARAWQRRLNDTAERRKVLPILIHGDASFSGQGVVAETLNLSQLEGYRTGGTIHIIINNQIGFTTSPIDGSSSQYCTSVAKMLGSPIFHVNGDDPIAAVTTIQLAFEFRQQFQRDVVVDMYCYRRHGHNEGDEPRFTQPLMYSAIEDHPPISDIFFGHLVKFGDITPDEVRAFRATFEERLNNALLKSKVATKAIVPAIRKSMACPALLDPVETAVPLEKLRAIGAAITREPEKIELNPKIKRWLQSRREMTEGQSPVDWSTAEALAFGSLLESSIPVRLSGQDSRRGTFTQRHSVLYDVKTRERYTPLNNIRQGQAKFCVYNSPLSEYAVLGFDYGYGLDFPDMLVLWEAQFGDFANGAQIMIDQYVVCSETKWGETSSIVLLLPHGYHGQGPEHSSARFERYLQACAEDNIQVAFPSTPVNYFHVLRRQALRKIKKPLILMTPKGLLRDPRCVSAIANFATGGFEEILPDTTASKDAKRVILCTGKVYFDLVDYRAAGKIDNAAIVRVEQLYPLHEKKLQDAVASYAKAEKIIWCQEESANMGAWSFIEPRLRKLFGRDILYAGREASASTATGSHAIHELEQRQLVEQAFSL
ncbi:MAG: 2-oxoglutarate dehydrogenase E1 component [Methylacidiphilales bacterium]|nr:2-oxoglutarate dehydrogenase E1 component [Candidatus Methylacidiphilales bacterium]